ncbi:DUF5375 family protein [Sodalis sp. RH16]|jgi:hypothetical protein|uniref:DUF5375 family protein n=1 Tax=Sodalis sp. RH16 TaxID=3394331 RepID=UPI0039B549DB
MNTAILTTELRIALYRRVAALAYQNFCLSKGMGQPLALDALEIKIAWQVEADHIIEYGLEHGPEYACEFLRDLVDPDFLTEPPQLTEWGIEAMELIVNSRIDDIPESKVLH